MKPKSIGVSKTYSNTTLSRHCSVSNGPWVNIENETHNFHMPPGVWQHGLVGQKVHTQLRTVVAKMKGKTFRRRRRRCSIDS